MREIYVEDLYLFILLERDNIRNVEKSTEMKVNGYLSTIIEIARGLAFHSINSSSRLM